MKGISQLTADIESVIKALSKRELKNNRDLSDKGKKLLKQITKIKTLKHKEKK